MSMVSGNLTLARATWTLELFPSRAARVDVCWALVDDRARERAARDGRTPTSSARTGRG
jgi:hypothetical protein